MTLRRPIVYIAGNAREIAANDRVINTGIVRSGTAPSSPQDNDAWLDTNTGHLKVYNGGAWHSPQYLLNVLEDTSPQLGGNLDVNGKDIVSTSNGDIDLDPNGSGNVVIKGNSTRGSGAVQLNCENKFAWHQAEVATAFSQCKLYVDVSDNGGDKWIRLNYKWIGNSFVE